ncbi:MAG: hypothetical protein JXM70_09190 [Pirellulales bacterium]|nr:hypothetical protein [Pirellulales bacterium]
MALARLGSHQNRKHDHAPGWIVLWRGWTKLQSMLNRYLVARRKNVGKYKIKTRPTTLRHRYSRRLPLPQCHHHTTRTQVFLTDCPLPLRLPLRLLE